MNFLKVAAHQPSFLPWAGYWHKFISCDEWIIHAGVMFDHRDYQNRVMIDGNWVGLNIEGATKNGRIADVRFADLNQVHNVGRSLRLRFRDKRYRFRDRVEPLWSILEGAATPWMIELNIKLLQAIGVILGQHKVVHLDTKVREGLFKTEKIDQMLLDYIGQRKCIMLQGSGARKFMDASSLKVPHETWFQRTLMNTPPDSVVKLLAHDPEPLRKIEQCAVWKRPSGTEHRIDGTEVK